MKVFLSWSLDHSKHIAVALKEWLPQVLHEVEPFVSTNIEAGARWQAEIASILSEAQFCIVVVTAENQKQPWLNFEAGAVAKAVDASRLVPLAVDLTPSEIELPLGQFQAQPLDVPGMTKVVESINSNLKRPLTKEHLSKAVQMWWSDLNAKLEQITKQIAKQPSATSDAASRRTDRDILEELLLSVRGLRSALVQPLNGRRMAPRVVENFVSDVHGLPKRWRPMLGEGGPTSYNVDPEFLRQVLEGLRRL
jgi:hypothetical protein